MIIYKKWSSIKKIFDNIDISCVNVNSNLTFLFFVFLEV